MNQPRQPDILGMDEIMKVYESDDTSMSLSARHLAIMMEHGKRDVLVPVAETLNRIGYLANRLIDIKKGSELDLEIRQLLQHIEDTNDTSSETRNKLSTLLAI